MGTRLAGKTALITAAGQGIGHATALTEKSARLWNTPHRVSITGRSVGDPNAVRCAP